VLSISIQWLVRFHGSYDFMLLIWKIVSSCYQNCTTVSYIFK